MMIYVDLELSVSFIQSLHSTFPETGKTSMLDIKQLWHKPFIAINANSNLNPLIKKLNLISHLYIEYLNEGYAT